VSENYVELERVSLRYNEDVRSLALKGTTFGVGQGEFIAVVGPSGCGKSSLMKVVTGLWPPTAGRVKIDGKAIKGPQSFVGMAFQNPTLLPWRTVLDNVMLPLEIVKPESGSRRRNREEDKARARELLALVGLKGYESAFPWQLSSH